MKFSDFKLETFPCKDDTNVIVFVKDEFGYRPFENIHVKYYGETCSGTINELHIDVNIDREYKSVHFPNNPEEDYIKGLLKRKNHLLKELKEVEEDLGAFNEDWVDFMKYRLLDNTVIRSFFNNNPKGYISIVLPDCVFDLRKHIHYVVDDNSITFINTDYTETKNGLIYVRRGDFIIPFDKIIRVEYIVSTEVKR